MAPKRKRNDTSSSGPARPAPHRPNEMSLSQHDRDRDRGNDSGSRNRGPSSRRGDRRDSFEPGAATSASAPSPISPALPRPMSSSSSTPVQPTNATSMAATAAALPSPAAPYYDYQIITDDRIRQWAQGGRQAVLEHGIQSRDDEDLMEVNMMYQEIMQSVQTDRIAPADAGSIVKEIIGTGPANSDDDFDFNPQDLFLDTLTCFMEAGSSHAPRQLREFVDATEIPAGSMLEILEPELLEQLGLISDSAIFSKIAVRQATNLLYRQANYNLLREETEGYSKLMVELWAMCNMPEPSTSRVREAWEKVKALIGTFDLDVGKVQDVTIDVLSSVVIKRHQCCVKFLRMSSWWPQDQIKRASQGFAGGLPIWADPDHDEWDSTPEEQASIAEQQTLRDTAFWERARQVNIQAYFELGNRELADGKERALAESSVDFDEEMDAEKHWIKTTGTRPPPGNRVAAQIFGFKLRFYASEARDSSELDKLPAALIWILALLIKIGFISLCHVWPHVWPFEEDMDATRAAKEKELEEKERAERPGAAMNALLMAAALPDDMAPPHSTRRDAAKSRAETEKKKAESKNEQSGLPEPLDQKGLLLQSLLLVGALPEALFILGKHPWMMETYEEVLPAFRRVLHQSISILHEQTHPIAPFAASTGKRTPTADQSGMTKGTGTLKTAPASKRRLLAWPHADNLDYTPNTGYKFYLNEWADSVPVCQTMDDFFTLSDTLMNVVGIFIGQDESLMVKITEIGKRSLADDPSPGNWKRWEELLGRLLVPALSLSTPNASSGAAVWSLLKQYPLATRYNIYAECYEGRTSRQPPVKKAFERTRLETLSHMKRLSTENIAAMGRKLARPAITAPGIVFKVALQQIEAYSNLIQVFVECGKSLTDLAYDVLVWSILSAVGNQQRSRTQEDSVLLTSKWLQALSQFTGKVFQRYPVMDPIPVVRYVNDQLFKGNSTDLVILGELVKCMGGIVSDVDFTDQQRAAMTGGKLLRSQELNRLGDKRGESVQSSTRLMKALVDTKIAGQLLVNIAQFRQNAVYNIPDETAHIKFLAARMDDTHQALVQYLDLLRSNLDAASFDALVPDTVQLMKVYGLEVGIAFMIGRESLRSEMMSPKKDDSQSQASTKVIDRDGDTVMSTDGVVGDAVNQTAAESADVDKLNLDDKEGNDAAGNATTKPANTRKTDPLLAALQPVIEAVPSILPEHVWQSLSPEFFVFFWALQLRDFLLPLESYVEASKDLQKKAADVMKDRSDMSRAGVNRKNQRKEYYLKLSHELTQESSAELERNGKTGAILTQRFSSWFSGTMDTVDVTSDAILEQCILPRMQLSALDADYCYRLVRFLHNYRAPNFKLMSLYDRLFNQNRLRSIIFTCTTREVEYFGRLLNSILEELSKWHGNKVLYEKEGLGQKEIQGKRVRTLLGFATAFDGEGKPTAFIEHDQFRDLLYTWHKNLNAALRSCLEGTEWMHIRNAITVLKVVLNVFPAVDFMANAFLKQLKTIMEREQASKTANAWDRVGRVDLSLVAQTAHMELARRKNKWILVQAFRPGNTSDAKDELKDLKDTAPSGPSSLRPSAPEFKPGQAKRTQTTATDVEEGEVKESKETSSRQASGSVSQKDSTVAKPAATTKPSLPEKPSSIPPKPVVSTNNSMPAKAPASKGLPTAPSSSTPARPELPRPPTIPSGGHPLPSRPDVSLPSRHSGSDRYFHPDRREPLGRDVRDRDLRERERDPRERDPRPPRENRDPREYREREPLGPHPRDLIQPPRDSNHGRDSRDGGRDFRGPDSSRPDRNRDLPPPDRRAAQEPASRDQGRTSERDSRDWQSSRPERRNDQGPAPDRDDRSRDRTLQTSSRSQDVRSPDVRAAPKDAAPSAPSSTPAPASTPAAPAQVEAPGHLINPDRARMLAQLEESERKGLGRDTRSSRDSRDQGRDRSRVDSPRRVEPQNANMIPIENPRDDRPNRHRHSDYHGSSRDSHVDGPSHGRGDRDVNRIPTDRGRDQQSGRPSEEHGRLNSSQQDPNYGRLNAAPQPISTIDTPTSAPTAPRGRGGRNSGRPAVVNTPPPPPSSNRQDNRFPGPNGPATEAPRAPSPERHVQPPTGPALNRSGRRSGYDGPSNNSNFGPPSTASPVGVHPERLRQINQSHAAPPPPPPPAGPAMHPDRLNQNNNNSHNSRQQQHMRPPMSTPDRTSLSAPNSGSRIRTVNTDGPFNNTSTPTGPAASNDRMRPGHHPLRGVQDILEKAQADNSRGSSQRRTSQRISLPNSDAQILTASSPVTTPVQERPDPVRDTSRREERSSRLSEQTGPPNGDDRGRERSSRRDHHGSERSSGRPSRVDSRERSPRREKDVKDPRDYRERDRRRDDGGGARSSGRSSRQEERGSDDRPSRKRSEPTAHRDKRPRP